MKKNLFIFICLFAAFSLIAFQRVTTKIEQNPVEVIYHNDDSQQVNKNQAAQRDKEANLHETVKLRLMAEGGIEEREARLYKAAPGFNIYILSGYSTKELAAGTTRIQMDYDPDFYVDITKLSKYTVPKQWLEDAYSKLRAFASNENEIHLIEPKEHFDKYFHNAYYYLLGSITNKGDIVFMLNLTGDKLLEYKMSIPMKEASDGAVPSLWAMLKSIT